jgi:bifunctional DNase/RNase
MKTIIEASFKPADQIELEAFGLTTGMDNARPVMLFREKGGEATLPVWLSPLDAGIALTQHQPQAFMLSPHDVTLNLLSKLGIKVETCHFREVKGNQQYVELIFSGSRKVKNMKVRADHAISFCLQAGTRFYCTRKYLEECRQVNAEISQPPPGAGAADGKRNRPYYMN